MGERMSQLGIFYLASFDGFDERCPDLLMVTLTLFGMWFLSCCIACWTLEPVSLSFMGAVTVLLTLIIVILKMDGAKLSLDSTSVTLVDWIFD